MATNLVSSVMQFLTPDMVARIARTLGIDPGSSRRRWLAAAVPAILASFAGLAAKPAGAQQLFECAPAAASRHARAHNRARSAGRDQARHRRYRLRPAFRSLLGGGGLNALVSAVSTHAGVDQNASRIGARAARYPWSSARSGSNNAAAALDADGLADLLSSQKGSDCRRDAVRPRQHGWARAACSVPLTAACAAAPKAPRQRPAARRRRPAGSPVQPATRPAGRAGAASDAAANAGQVAYAAARAPRPPTWPLWILGLVVLGGTRLVFSRRPRTAKAGRADPRADQQARTAGSRRPVHDAERRPTCPPISTSSVDNRAQLPFRASPIPHSARAALPKLQASDRASWTGSTASPPSFRRGSRKELAAVVGVIDAGTQPPVRPSTIESAGCWAGQVYNRRAARKAAIVGTGLIRQASGAHQSTKRIEFWSCPKFDGMTCPAAPCPSR